MSLVLETVKKTYREPSGSLLPVLNIDRFEIGKGEQVALVGSSGGGKTTLLNIISGITLPDSGTVKVDDNDITSMHEVVRDRFRAERIGFVFQTFNLLPAFSAIENVLLGMSFSNKGVDRGKAKDLLDKVGLSHRLDHRPGQLSVGEQQRVAICRAMITQPKLILADEPTGNLDPKNKSRILKLLFEQADSNGQTLVVVTHDMGILSDFDRTVDFEKLLVEQSSADRTSEVAQ